MKIRRAVATRARSMFREDTILFFGLGRVDEAESRTLKKKSDLQLDHDSSDKVRQKTGPNSYKVRAHSSHIARINPMEVVVGELGG